ncbi:MAG: NAD+ synthase [Myxococcota bacterium]|jgi:NAD+ synthetase|nr:NAD+ synthase [Myxococcota bacterium]
MRIACAQLDTTVGDLAGNERLVQAAVARATSEGADLLLLPEMVLPGYPPQDLLERDDFVHDNLAALDRVASHCTGISALVGHVDFNRSGQGRRLVNCVSLCAAGRRQATVAKTLLPTYDVFDEARFFEPAVSHPLLTVGGRRIAVTICEDLWALHGLPEHRPYAHDPLAELLAQGPELIVNLSASPFSLGKLQQRLAVVAAQVGRAGLPLVYCNAVGANDGVIFDGSSLVLDGGGQVLRQLASFAPDFAIVEVPLAGEPAPPHHAPPAPAPPPPEEEQAYRALVLGIADFLAKTGFHQVVIGLSGGLDSALVATLAVDALGPARVLGVAMPSPFSSPGSLIDARALAHNLGIPLWELPIEPAMQAYEQQLAAHFAGMPSDVTEENLQARIRGNLLMAISNKLGHLVLSTGNKSELAVGYCTLYGDMCGGLAVLGDVPKTLAYRIARWINRDGERIPVSTLTKPPSAELRPGQVDQDSLPPYEELDPILRGYVEEGRSVPELLAQGCRLETLRRVLPLIDRQEFKRRQGAPVLRISSRAFGTGRRYPVVQKYDPFQSLVTAPRPEDLP